ncbi:MAG TPA: isoprenylcysteine carboxylmethyltransferase family protein, partial [Mycobacterium sp.]
MKVALQALAAALLGFLLFAMALFLPAGTLDYWQGWLFIAVFAVCTVVPTIYLAVRMPAALQRRLTAGPTAETRPAQRIIIAAAGVAFVATLVVSVLDWRYGWSTVPVAVVLVGNLFVAVGLLVSQL